MAKLISGQIQFRRWSMPALPLDDLSESRSQEAGGACGSFPSMASFLPAFVANGFAGGLATGASFMAGYIASISLLSLLLENRSNDSGQPYIDVFVFVYPVACVGGIAASLSLLPLSWSAVGGWAAMGSMTSILVWRDLARPKMHQRKLS